MNQEHIREWARRNGYEVGQRGRMPGWIVDRYYIAHPYMVRREEEKVTMTEEAPIVAEYRDEIPNPEKDTWRNLEEQEVGIPSEAAQSHQNGQSDLEAAIAAIARKVVPNAPNMDEGRVREIALDVATEVLDTVNTPTVYAISVGDRPTVMIEGATHKRFADVVKITGAGLHAYLVGPPGTGKTTLCSQVAEALSLPFGMIPCDPTMPASKLFGFIDAGGEYRRTVFRDIYENGGVFLFDELDNAHPGIIASINGAIANGHCAFPDGMVKRSENFRCIAAANTFGTGATKQFVGRNQLDAATLDRFVTVTVEIDEQLETTLTLANLPDDATLANDWLGKVREWRGRVDLHNLQVIISPRASIEGARLLSVGFSIEEVAEMKVWKGMDKGTRDKIERGY